MTAADSAFSLACNGTAVALSVSRENDTTYVLDPQQPLPGGTTCTLRVEGDDYRDDDADDPPDTGADYSATFSTEAVTGLRIHDIQGASHVSPYRGVLVAGVPGVITARRTNGYFIQDPQPDRDERTSEGVFVFTSSAPDASLTPGTAVTISGRVSEFRSGGATGTANLTTTEITSATALPAGTGTIAPTLVGKGGRVPPTTVIEDDVASPGDVEQGDPLFDPREDGIDFYESLEGMLTEVRNAVVVGPTVSFGSGATANKEIPVLADGGAGASVRAPRGPILVRGFDRSAPQEYRRGDFNPERITLNDAGDPDGTFLPLADVRDRFTAPVRAVVDYSFGNYKFLALNDPPLADGKLKPEVTRAKKRDELAIAGYNVENLDGLDPQDRYDRVAAQIVDNLRSPDILSLEEIQDNDGAASAAPTAANVTFTRLLAAIKAAGGPTYDYREIDPASNQDGGEPNGNIRVAFLFRTDNRDLDVRRPAGRDGDDRDRAGGRPAAAPAVIQPRARRSHQRGVEQQPQAAGGRVPLPRQAAVRDRQPLQLQGRRRPDVRALPGAAAAERGAAPRPGGRPQRVRQEDPRDRPALTRRRARRPQRLRVLGDRPAGSSTASRWSTCGTSSRRTSTTATSSRATARCWTTSSSAPRCSSKAIPTSTPCTSTPSSAIRSQTTTRRSRGSTYGEPDEPGDQHRHVG